MKKIKSLILSKKHLILTALYCILIPAACFHTLYDQYLSKHLPTSGTLDTYEAEKLEKDNSRLKGVLDSILPENGQKTYEDSYKDRGFYGQAQGFDAPAETHSLQNVLKHGTDVKYNVLHNNSYYLRPLYDPSWKGAYYRGWLYLPRKIVNARHRLFIYPFGLSSIYDFTGSLGNVESAAIDYHRNINFLIYNFEVQNIKIYGHQVLLIGEPLRTGTQTVSVVQDDLLPEGSDTSGIIFYLVTPEGYELDYIYGRAIRYEYLKNQIKEHTVKPSNLDLVNDNNIIKLIEENLNLKKQLAYFVPLEDEVISQDKCRPVPPDFPYEAPDIRALKLKVGKLEFKKIYSSKYYKRPVYDPQWSKNCYRRWCYVPEQVCLNLHKLFALPANTGDLAELFGLLSFYEVSSKINTDDYNLLVYSFNVTEAFIYKGQILLSGIPSRTGAEVITLSKGSIPQGADYLVRLATPDNQEADYDIMYGK